MIEKLNLALSHQVFKVNDVNYQAKEEAETELIKTERNVTNLYTGKLALQQEEYEEYTNATDDVAPTINPILVDEFETVSFMKNDGTLYYNKYN